MYMLILELNLIFCASQSTLLKMQERIRSVDMLLCQSFKQVLQILFQFENFFSAHTKKVKEVNNNTW